MTTTSPELPPLPSQSPNLPPLTPLSPIVFPSRTLEEERARLLQLSQVLTDRLGRAHHLQNEVHAAVNAALETIRRLPSE